MIKEHEKGTFGWLREQKRYNKHPRKIERIGKMGSH